ncbi:MAG: hypothetical protein VYD64_09960 [Pseudomonadota bacterium]|nr:hypothetical protein [Pseudomonadota bacterium]
MSIVRSSFGLTVFLGMLASAPLAHAGNLSDGLGGIGNTLGGVVGAVGDTVGDTLGGTTASLGGATAGVGAAVSDTTNGVAAGAVGQVGGTVAAAGASVTSTDKTKVLVGVDLFNHLLQNSVVNQLNTSARIGVPGVATASVNQSGTQLGIGLTLGGSTTSTPGDDDGDDGTTADDGSEDNGVGGTTLASLSNADLARYKVRCRMVLGSPGIYDRDLVQLCRMVSKAR